MTVFWGRGAVAKSGCAFGLCIIQERQQQFGGRVAQFELMVGVKLRDYLTKIGQIRRATAKRRASKREQWWARKYGKKKDGGDGADANDDGDD
eukprot:5602333-Pleurochrysis_carterae.AAC.2